MSNYRLHHNQISPIELNTLQPVDSMHSLGAAIVDLTIDKILSYEEFMRGVFVALIRNRK
jgi:hypothetical protein